MDPLLASSGGICTFPHHSRTFTIDELSNTYDTALPLPSPRFRPSCASPIQRIYTNCSPVLRIALLAAPVRSGHPRHLTPPPPFWPCAAAFSKSPFDHNNLRRRSSLCASLFRDVLFGNNRSIVLLARHFRCDNKPRQEIQKQ
jgi:hypothetical protein